MNILGIHDGHLATASLLMNGRLAAVVSEERLTRKKNHGGVPAQAIATVLRQAGLSGSDVDIVSLAALTEPLTEWELDTQQARRRLMMAASRMLPARVLASDAVRRAYVAVYRHKRSWRALEQALEVNGIEPTAYRGHVREHHECHAATAYYLAPFRQPDRPMLVVTMDASGDGLCATVSRALGGRLERLHGVSSYHSLGEFYTRITELLGMRPLDHEYKVMGLAPYAPPELRQRAYDILSTYYRLGTDDLSFQNVSGCWGPDLRDRMARDLRGVRFDGIAAGAQQLLEELVVRFVAAWQRRTGFGQLAVAGGVFMNVKLNMLLSELSGLDELFLMPSCGDESLGIGASLLMQADHDLAADRPVAIAPLDQLYLGPSFDRDTIARELQAARDRVDWQEVEDIEPALAALLADGQIVGRLTGAMEWGARSLGNRAILADPRDLRTAQRINRAIKMRDYWMPFAASILEERAADYLDNPRGWPAPYMITAFRSTPRARTDLPCGLHPFDHTCRPQIVTRKANPSYHRLLSEFERLTGVGALVNTSFNLHGEPIVCGPADAVHTLINSDLDAVAIGPFLVRRAT